MITSNMTIDCLKSVERLDKHPVRKGGLWQPVSHTALVDSLMNHLGKTRWDCRNLKIAISKDKMDMAVSVEIDALRPKITLPIEGKLCLGMTHSNDGHKRVKFYIGVATMCGNETTSIAIERMSYKQRHTKFLDLDRVIRTALDAFKSRAKSLPVILKYLTITPVTPTELERVLMEAGRAKLMPWSRIGRVDNLFSLKDDKSSWGLLCAFARVAKSNPPIKQMFQVSEFRNLLPVN